MARKSDAERLAELDAKKSALAARMQAIQARQKERDRKDDIRKKILVGGIMLAEAQINPQVETGLMAQLDKHLDRAADRALFGLPPKGSGAKLKEQV